MLAASVPKQRGFGRQMRWYESNAGGALMRQIEIDRRTFLARSAMGLGAMGLAGWNAHGGTIIKKPYTGPNVIMIRFGGGVRRQETIEAESTYAPYFLHDYCKRGTLFKNMEMSNLQGVETSHGQGTLYLLTGKYNSFDNVSTDPIGERFESHVPTIFEYFRKTYDVPEYQTLIVNNEDRTDEEFYSFSNHHLFGVDYRSNVLSLYRFKVFLLRRQLERNNLSDQVRLEKQRELSELEALDQRVTSPGAQAPEIQAFWERWRQFYGETGFVNPRGDSLLTELTVRALKELRPKLVMVNYTAPDYVHWGNPSHYTRGITAIDNGIRRLVEAVEADEEYRDNTIFVIVPDCGRDTNRLMDVPFQHHFGSKSSHEIFGLVMGPGIAQGQVVDGLVDQVQVASTVGQVMGFPAGHTEGPVLEQAFA
jgi:hypothetical protein